MKHRFQVLDIFRGIFASLVMFFHVADFADTPLLNNGFIYNSDMFVDFFFVLSGFVITYNYQSLSTGPEFRKFLTKRVARIYPLHVIMLLVFVIVESSKMYLAPYIHINNPVNENNSISTFITSLFLLNSVKILGVKDVSWNIPSWSISAEMISYLVFGFVMILLYKLNLRRNRNLIFLLVAGLSATLLVTITDSLKLNYSFDYGFLRGIIGFFVGGLCYATFDQLHAYSKSIKPSFYTLAESIVLLSIAVCITNGHELKRIGLLFEVLFFVAILVFSFERGAVSDLLKKSSFLHKVGTYSYSIYMTHALLISLFNIAFIRVLKLPPSAYTYLIFLNFYIVYKVSEWTYANIEMRFKDFRLFNSDPKVKKPVQSLSDSPTQ
ncbi:acyltransferase family protein [Larkinella sp.]|uniref:acyltransferase family protein n=1 Tax=Larkinella sp. TaxID=2034517 RepID=UPI003BAB3818